MADDRKPSSASTSVRPSLESVLNVEEPTISDSPRSTTMSSAPRSRAARIRSASVSSEPRTRSRSSRALRDWTARDGALRSRPGRTPVGRRQNPSPVVGNGTDRRARRDVRTRPVDRRRRSGAQTRLALPGPPPSRRRYGRNQRSPPCTETSRPNSAPARPFVRTAVTTPTRTPPTRTVAPSGALERWFSLTCASRTRESALKLRLRHFRAAPDVRR